MRILVTGGAGFIGSALTRHLLTQTDASVTVVDKLTYAANLNSLSLVSDHPKYKLLKLDICDGEAMTAVFADAQPDLVLHLAAETHVDRSITGARDFIQTNVMGTYQLLEAARRFWDALPGTRRDAFRFVHVSTDEVYGSLGPEGLFEETTPYDPSSPYSASKAASDHLAVAWYRTYGLPVILSNCSNNYGPYQFPEKLIPLMILNAIQGHELPVYGDGRNVRDWLFVEDHVKALMLIAQNGRVGETYNIGGGNERTNLQVVETICDILDELQPSALERRNLIKFVADRPGHDQRYAISAAKLSGELGWQAGQSFDTGILRTIKWYIDNQTWWQPLRQGVYQGQRLGLTSAKEAS